MYNCIFCKVLRHSNNLYIKYFCSHWTYKSTLMQIKQKCSSKTGSNWTEAKLDFSVFAINNIWLYCTCDTDWALSAERITGTTWVLFVDFIYPAIFSPHFQLPSLPLISFYFYSLILIRYQYEPFFALYRDLFSRVILSMIYPSLSLSLLSLLCRLNYYPTVSLIKQTKRTTTTSRVAYSTTSPRLAHSLLSRAFILLLFFFFTFPSFFAGLYDDLSLLRYSRSTCWMLTANIDVSYHHWSNNTHHTDIDCLVNSISCHTFIFSNLSKRHS